MSNKMDKIKNYNQILLAVAGTIGIIFLLISSIIFIMEMMPWGYEEEGMIANEETVILNEQGLRKEIISFDNFQIADSAEQILILPVTQASLDNPESYDKSLGLINSFGEYYGEFVHNNLVVYYGKQDSSVIVFKERLSIVDYMVSKRKEGNFLIVTACNNDSNKDNFLNSKDLQDLHMFNLDLGKFSKIETPINYTVLEVYQPVKWNQLICRLGVDRNENGVFDDNLEPTVFMKLNLNKRILESVVKEKNIEELQNILEGK